MATTIEKQLAAVDPILTLIRKNESNDDYRAVWGGIAQRDRPANLTGMTIAAVLRWQDSIDARYRSEAAGGYQIMEDTLRGCYRQAGIPDSQLFDEVTQDKLALFLLKRRGLDDYLDGKIDAYKFALNLSKEWASFPVCTEGVIGSRKEPLNAEQSYYAGDGLNKAHVSVDDVIAAIRAIGAAPASARPRARPVESKTIQKAGAALALGGGGSVAVVAEKVSDPNLDIQSIARDLETAVGTLDRLQAQNSMLLVVIAGMALLNLWLMRDRLKDWWEGRR